MVDISQRGLEVSKTVGRNGEASSTDIPTLECTLFNILSKLFFCQLIIIRYFSSLFLVIMFLILSCNVHYTNVKN
jgi:hypothetical protein